MDSACSVRWTTLSPRVAAPGSLLAAAAARFWFWTTTASRDLRILRWALCCQRACLLITS